MRLSDDVTALLAITSGALVSVGITAVFLIPSSGTPPARMVRETVPVVVAARDLDLGEVLTPADVKVVEWPGNAAPVGFATAPAVVVGFGVRVPMELNEPVLAQKLTGKDIGIGLTKLIPSGYRAISVQTDDEVVVAGWVKPGGRVDVMVSRTNGRPSRLLLENAKVLGIDRSVAQQEDGTASVTSVVTLLVLPADAEKLAIALTNGELHFMLRNSR